MNPLIQLKKAAPVFLVALVCIGLLPTMQAVVPAPDGGYPGGNTAEGQNALLSQTTGGFNAAIGWLSLRGLTTGNFNTAVGAGTLALNNADQNTAIGTAALLLNTTGTGNTANGAFSLQSNTTGANNTAIGLQALVSNFTGSANTAIGAGALGGNIQGNNNIALGDTAGLLLTNGDDNIDIGNFGGANEYYTIRIGRSDVHTGAFIAGIAGQTVGAGGSYCFVDNAGKLGVFLSARRFKKDIADMGGVSEAILALRPVTFHYKPELDKTGIPQFGLVAEEVAKVNPDLVTHDAKGDISTVRYDAVNAMLLNEFLKEHRKVEDQDYRLHQQEATIAQQQKEFASKIALQQKQIAALTAGLQKVSAQLEASKPAPQVVNNP